MVANSRTEHLCEGRGSLVAKFRKVEFLRPLMTNVAISYPRMESFAPCVRPLGTLDVIELPNTAEAMLAEQSHFLCERLSLVHRSPWRVLGLPSRSFSTVNSFAHWLAALALDFTVAHELGHVVLGHLNLWPRRRGFCFREVVVQRREPGKALEARDRRALEVGADHAAAWFIHFLLPDLAEESPRYSRLGWHGSLAGVLFASHFVFACFAEQDSPARAVRPADPFDKLRNHPPSIGRMQIVEKAFLRQPPTARQRSRNQHIVLKVREAIGQSIACQALPVDSYSPLLGKSRVLNAYMNASVDRWQELSKKCLPTSRWAEMNRLAEQQWQQAKSGAVN